MVGRHPEIEPYERGGLDVGQGNRVAWEVSGNPAGTPAALLHGGPGSGSSPRTRRLFDPARFRILQLDQRNCGRSTPHASDPATDLAADTTDHLVADLELLRETLGVDRWWCGARPGARCSPSRPRSGTPGGCARWCSPGRRRAGGGRPTCSPAASASCSRWPGSRFRAGVAAAERDGDLAAAYSRLLESPDPLVRAEAARDWCGWEDAMLPTSPPDPRYRDPRLRLAFARIVTHYWSHGSFLPDDGVLPDAGRLAGIPGVVVQGTLDLINLLGTPWELLRVWPGELVLVDDSGHGGGVSATEAMIAALDRFAET